MALTPARMTALKAHIIANTDPFVVTALAEGGHAGIAEWYSGIASPSFTVWRSTVGSNEIINSITFSGAGGFIARTAGERETFLMLLARGSIEPWRANIRQAFSDIFSGAGTGAPETRTALLAVSKRLANNIEKLFATGTGSDASPATLTYEGPIYYSDISEALAFEG